MPAGPHPDCAHADLHPAVAVPRPCPAPAPPARPPRPGCCLRGRGVLPAWAHTAPSRPFTSGLSQWLFPLGQGATESLGAPFAEGPSLCPFLFVYTVTGSRRLSQVPRGRLVALLFHAEVLRNTCQAMRTISLYCFSLGLIVTHTDVATGAAWGGGGTVAGPSGSPRSVTGRGPRPPSGARRQCSHKTISRVFFRNTETWRQARRSGRSWRKSSLGGDGDRGFATLLQPRGQRSGPTLR